MQDPPGIEASPVIGDREDDPVRTLSRRERHGCFGRLPGALPILRRFQAVDDGVGHQVDEGLSQPIDDRLVELGLAARSHQPNSLPVRVSHLAHQQVEAAEHGCNGHQPGGHERTLQPLQCLFQRCQRMLQIGKARASMSDGEVPHRLPETQSCDHRLNEGLQQPIEPSGIYPNRAHHSVGAKLSHLRAGSPLEPAPLGVRGGFFRANRLGLDELASLAEERLAAIGGKRTTGRATHHLHEETGALEQQARRRGSQVGPLSQEGADIFHAVRQGLDGREAHHG